MSNHGLSLSARAPGDPEGASPWFAVGVLFSMNLLNYIDRYVFYAAGPRISEELKFSDTQFGVLSVAFMVVYTLVCPFVGWLGDRYHRRRLLAFGVTLWSVATVGTAFARGFEEMFVWRAVLGIGEATYGIIAPAFLSDLFETRRRGRVLSLYFLALPLGGAIGYAVGGWFAKNGHQVGHFLGGLGMFSADTNHWLAELPGWRYAFWVVGIPGLFAAVAGLMMHDPGRGASEGVQDDPGSEAKSSWRDSVSFLAIPSFLFNTAGQAAVTFAIGGYAVWGATFYHRVRGMPEDTAGLYIGALTAGAALIGIVLGMFGSDLLQKFTKRAYLIWSSLAIALAIPFATMAILQPTSRLNLSMTLLFIASVLMASVLGPSNTVTANVVAAQRRARGYALCIFLVHLFGDISSPLLIGFISDFAGKAAIATSGLGRWLASNGIEAVGSSNLTFGMLAVVPMLALSSLFYLIGSKSLPADMEKARAASLGADDTGAHMYHS